MNIEALEKMLAAGTDNAMLRFTLGKLHFDAANFPAAVMHLERAVAHDATYSAAWKWLGRALAQSQRRDDAIAAFQQGIAVAEEKGDKQAVKEMQVFLRRLTRGDNRQ